MGYELFRTYELKEKRRNKAEIVKPSALFPHSPVPPIPLRSFERLELNMTQNQYLMK